MDKDVGTATIKATSTQDPSRSAICSVTVEPATAMLTITYRGNGNTSPANTIPTDHQAKTPGTFVIKQPGNMLRRGHLFGGWSDPVGYVRQPGQYYADKADGGTWIQTAVWNPVVVPAQHPTISGAPTGPYSTADAAALAWANYIYSTSLFARHELVAAIYQTVPGEFTLSGTVSCTPHSFTVTLQTGRVAYVHTHPNSNTFSDADIGISTRNNIDAYVAAPTTYGGTSAFQLLRYDVSTDSTITVGSVTLRNLSTTVQTNLASFYLDSWINHLSPPCGFGCENRQWPTHPWPPA